MAIFRRLAVLTVSLVLSACGSTEKLIKTQRLAARQEESVTLKSNIDSFSAQPDPQANSDFSAFVSVGTLNQILSGLDATELQQTTVPEIKVILDSARADFSSGFPNLLINATAKSNEWNIELKRSVRATLVVDVDNNMPRRTDFFLNIFICSGEWRRIRLITNK